MRRKAKAEWSEAKTAAAAVDLARAGAVEKQAQLDSSRLEIEKQQRELAKQQASVNLQAQQLLLQQQAKEEKEEGGGGGGEGRRR
eukprot:COSAG05_NODE_942_length_6503_cov_11.183948_5_plen_85_part_00